MKCIFVVLFFVISTFTSCNTTSDETCTASGQCENTSHEKSKYVGQTSTTKWNVYLEKIDEALQNYTPCNETDCSCYLNLIRSDLKPWKESGITKDMIEAAKGRGTHYQVINHKLYRESECMFPFRCLGVEHFILGIIGKLPDMEFVLNTRDWPQASSFSSPLPVFSFSKTPQYFDITYPAWTFWAGGPAISLYPTGIGRWDQQRTIITKEADMWPWTKKLGKGFFRGSRTSSDRDPLILLSRKEPELVDAQYTKNQAWKSDKDTLGAAPAAEVSLESHCKFKYLFNFRGVAASFRFKHLFLCHSLVFHVDSDWTEFFYLPMKPWVHYIPVKQDLSDVGDLLDFARNNDDIVNDIAERGFQFIWDHLKMEDVSCYWYRLLRRYATLLKFKPVRNESLEEIKKNEK